MLITLDTSNITDADRAVLALVLEGYDGQASSRLAEPIQVREADISEPEKPSRSRRTKLEIAFDTANEEYEATRTPALYEVLVDAYNSLRAKDPNNIRLETIPSEYYGEPSPEAGTPETDAEADQVGENVAPTEPTTEVTIETVTELATKLLAGNKAKLREILDDFGAKRVGELPEQEYGRFAEKLRAALSKASAESTLV